jgi:hypothetical protein
VDEGYALTTLGEATRWRTVQAPVAGDPRQVAGFRIQGRLGEGGMGVVFLADHPQHGTAAVKLISAARVSDETFRARFRREIEAASRVAGPRVARVLDADPDAPVPWLATTFVDGPTLAEAVPRTGPMAGERLVALAVALADALTAIHAAGVVHRDLKPSNILLTAETPVVIDFGVAAAREAPSLTQTGMSVGTPGWMAPEQVVGQRVDRPADVFAWGLVLAFAASGRPPYGEGAPHVLCYRIVHERPAVPGLPAPLDGLVAGALDRDPGRRPVVPILVQAIAGEATVPAGPPATEVIVPTLVARGWGPEALSTPPGDRVVPPPPGSPRRPPPPPPPGVRSLLFAGTRHHDPRALAAALQRNWDLAVRQVFGAERAARYGELTGFLRHHGQDAALRVVTSGAAGQSQVARAMARLLLALDPQLAPAFGGVLLTPPGLQAAARAALDGDAQAAARLVEIQEAGVLRLWRTLPGMGGAAAIDARWRSSCAGFEQLIGVVGVHAGWPTTRDIEQGKARLLLCAVDRRHVDELARHLRVARVSGASRNRWWLELAEQGRTWTAAAVVAVMTGAKADGLARWSGGDPRPTAIGRLPSRRRAGLVYGLGRRRWAVVLVTALLAFHLWLAGRFQDRLAFFLVADRDANRLDQLDLVRSWTPGVTLLVVALPAMAVLGRVVGRHRPDPPLVRLYVVASAAVEAAVGAALVVHARLVWLVADVAEAAADNERFGPGYIGSWPTDAGEAGPLVPWSILAVTHVAVVGVGVALVVVSLVRAAVGLVGAGGTMADPPSP